MSKDIRDKRKKVICDLVADSLYVPMKEKELALFLQVSKEEKQEFHNMGLNDDLINSIIWNTSLTSEASTKRPLSKMTIDIINQVKEYVYEV